MNTEIERKFLPKADTDFPRENGIRIKQGYLSSAPGRSVRVRIKGDTGILTIKGTSSKGRFTRYEWETEIPLTDAHELFNLCEPGIIDKTRYHVKIGKHVFEIDEFYGENEGLVIIEIELKSEDEHFEKPDWLGTEVTGIKRYYNATLSKHPFNMWK